MRTAETIEAALRAFLARVLGFQRTETVEGALRSLHLWAIHCTALVLLGDDEPSLVSVARGLHRFADGAGRPFIICDQQLQRAPGSAVTAVQAAQGGSLCVRRRRLPKDFPSAVPMLRDPALRVRLIVCASMRFDPDPFLACPIPIVVPSLQERGSELTRIVDEYALDAIGTLGNSCFFDADRAWIREHAVGSLAEIETATLRLVAIRQAGSIHAAAARLGMSHVALGQWFKRHREGKEQRVAAPDRADRRAL